jgi:hypothetical protein
MLPCIIFLETPFHFDLSSYLLALLSRMEIVHTIFSFPAVMWPLESELLNNGLKCQFLKLTQLISCRMLWLLQLSYCDFPLSLYLYILLLYANKMCEQVIMCIKFDL